MEHTSSDGLFCQGWSDLAKAKVLSTQQLITRVAELFFPDNVLGLINEGRTQELRVLLAEAMPSMAHSRAAVVMSTLTKDILNARTQPEVPDIEVSSFCGKTIMCLEMGLASTGANEELFRACLVDEDDVIEWLRNCKKDNREFTTLVRLSERLLAYHQTLPDRDLYWEVGYVLGAISPDHQLACRFLDWAFPSTRAMAEAECIGGMDYQDEVAGPRLKERMTSLELTAYQIGLIELLGKCIRELESLKAFLRLCAFLSQDSSASPLTWERELSLLGRPILVAAGCQAEVIEAILAGKLPELESPDASEDLLIRVRLEERFLALARRDFFLPPQ